MNTTTEAELHALLDSLTHDQTATVARTIRWEREA